MSSVSAISAVQSSSSAAYLPTIEALQSQLLLYVQFAKGTSPASVDFKALQFAIATRDYSDAENELARLRVDSEQAAPAAAATTSATEASNSNAIAGADNSGNSNTPPSIGSLIDVTA